MPDPIAPVETSPAIAAVEGPTGPIQTINATEPKPSAQPKSAPSTPSRPEPRVVSVREALGLDRKEKVAADGRTRDDKGKFVPEKNAGDKSRDSLLKKVEARRDKPVAKSVAAPPAEPTPAPVVAPIVQKIKVGEQEMTQEELTAHIAALEKRAADAAKPVEKAPEPVVEPVVSKTPEQVAAEDQAETERFIAERMKDYEMPQEEVDRMLATGDLKPLFERMIRAEMHARKFLANTVNPVISELRGGMKPLLERDQQVAAFQAEENFLSQPDHSDIAAHKEAGRKAIREAADLLHHHYDQLQRLISVGKATPDEIAMAAALEKPDQWNADVAFHARRALGTQKPATPTAVVPTPTPIVVKPRPEPPGGQPTGAGGGEPQSSQRSVMQRISHTR